VARGAAVTGIDSTRPAACAPQFAASGQRPQTGRAGVQTVAPRSIRAWLKVPAPRRGTSVAAIRQIGSSPAPPTGSAWPLSRASTRRELASTIGAGRSNAIEAIAPAVYRPTPGSDRSPATDRGTTPPCSATSAWAAACSCRARR